MRENAVICVNATPPSANDIYNLQRNDKRASVMFSSDPTASLNLTNLMNYWYRKSYRVQTASHQTSYPRLQ